MFRTDSDYHDKELLAWSYDEAQIASFDVLSQITERGVTCFVWPDEGCFINRNKWEFNDKHATFEPLVIDAFTASAMMKVYEALTTLENKEKFKRMVGNNRGTFCKLVEFTWKQFNKK